MSDSFPKKLKLFRAWAKAMEQGAVVGTPTYGAQAQASSPNSRTPSGRKFRRKRRRKRRKRAD